MEARILPTTILFLANLLNLFISSSSALVDSLEFSLYKIMLSANGDGFTFPFPIWMPFIYYFV